jgi:hypothetical protein
MERMEVQPVVQQGPLRPRPRLERGEAEEGTPAATVAAAGVRAAVVEEAEAIQEAEDDTEHEAQMEEERTETEADIFGEREGVNAEIVRRMNRLAALLNGTRVTGRVIYAADQRAADQGQVAADQGRYRAADQGENGRESGERNEELAALESLLDSFRMEEVPEESLVPVSLEDPILLLLAQHRSFRICRREFFCPEENCHPSRPIRNVKQLAVHMQSVHGASEGETDDWINYFIGM